MATEEGNGNGNGNFWNLLSFPVLVYVRLSPGFFFFSFFSFKLVILIYCYIAS